MSGLLRRRELLLCSSGLAWAGCSRLQALLAGDASAEEPYLGAEEIAREPLVPAAGSFSGTLEARRFMSYTGCADQGTTVRWLVLEHRGLRLPLRIVSERTLRSLQAGDEGALENDELRGEPLSPEDAVRLGVNPGQRIVCQAACAALHFSGTLTLEPVYGLCTSRLGRS